MIKSDLGTIEVNGTKLVIMAEFETLLVALKRVLGEEKYNLVLQRASEKELTDKGEEALRKGQKRRVAEALSAFLSEMEDK